MKIVIAGSTGFIGQELVRQALLHPQIDSVVALARRDHELPEDLRKPEIESKFTSVSCSDFKNYPQYVKDEIAGADACIWYVQLTLRTRATSNPAQAHRSHAWQIKTVYLGPSPHDLLRICPLRSRHLCEASAQGQPRASPIYIR
jgi:dTDP-4-dehydrorhamnose reductase